MGTSTSTRRSRLRSIRSGEPMATRRARPAGPPKQNTRECSRYRPTMERTRMWSDSPGTPGRRQQRPRTTRSTETPACDARYRASITPGIGETVRLDDDPAVGSGPPFGVDGRHQSRPHGQGRDHESPESRRVARPREQIEEVADVGPNGRVRCEQAQVLVGPGGFGVVVARPDMAVPADLGALPADHQADLGVGLQSGQAVDHLDTGLLEHPRPGDVGPLVEPGLELDHHGDLFARPRGSDQRLHDGAPLPRPVEGLLDGQDVGVRRGCGHEGLDRAAERLIGVVDEDVSPSQNREDVGVAGERGGHYRGPRLGRQVRAVQLGEGGQTTEVEGSVDQVHAVLGHVDLGDERVQEIGGDPRRDLEAHRLTEPTTVELELHGGREVVGLVLVHGEIDVARHPEDLVLLDDHPGEDALQMGRHHLFHRDQAPAIGQRQQPGQDGWHLHLGEALLAAPGVRHPHHQVE